MNAANIPLVSVVMNCRNGEKFVREAIDSVLGQSIDDWELVFWDNRSTDSTAEIVKSCGDCRIRYFLSDSDDDLGQARNRALSHASGEWVAILDSDDVWHSNFLEKQLTLLKEVGASLIYSNAESFYPDGRKHLYSKRSDKSPVRIDYRALALDYDICISAVVFKRRILSELSYVIDPALKVAEEADLFIRIANRYPVVFNPEVLARYRMHAGSDTWRSSEDFIHDAKKIMANFEELGMDPGPVRDGILQAAYWTSAMSSWMKSDGGAARRYLRSMQERRIRGHVLFCLSFFPYGLVSPLLRLAGKRVI